MHQSVFGEARQGMFREHYSGFAEVLQDGTCNQFFFGEQLFAKIKSTLLICQSNFHSFALGVEFIVANN